jgi:hypothetical protein
MFPVLLVLSAIFIFPKARQGTIKRGVIIHLGLLLSIILSQSLIFKIGKLSTFYNSSMFILPFLASIIISLIILGRFGMFYSLSAALQQLCMLSVTSLLLPVLPIGYTILLIIPVYSFSHLLQPKKWQFKIPLTLIWGALSLIIFTLIQDVYLNMSIHNFIGTFLISKNLIYHKTEFNITR